VEKLLPIYIFEELRNVLAPYATSETVEIELTDIIGVDKYPAVPRPCTVDTRLGELIYPAVPRFCTVDTRLGELM